MRLSGDVGERMEVIYAALRRSGGWRSSREVRDAIYAGPRTNTYMSDSETYTAMRRLRKAGRVESHHVNSRVVWWRAR